MRSAAFPRGLVFSPILFSFVILASLLFFSVPSAALAGPNADGTLVAHDASLPYDATDGSVSICGQGAIPPECASIDTRIDGVNAGPGAVFKVYAAFIPGTTPRLMGITWGVDYDPAGLRVAYWGKCGDFELNDPTWPAPHTGASVTWDLVQTGLLTPVYWFSAYNYAGQPAVFTLRGNPDQGGGYFGDDAIPAHLDPIEGYGAMGFDTDGVLICPSGTAGACCLPDGTCLMTVHAGCAPPNVWQGEGVSCSPNPCPQPLGACCSPDGTCAEMTHATCAAPNNWQGPDTSCDPNPCPQPGACCHADGTCVITLQSQCSGLWHGAISSCDPNPCPQPGACCAPDGICTITLSWQCPWSWQGPGTTCDPNPCPQPGACCHADGTCSFLVEWQCDGTWLGAGTGCTPNPCPQPLGACCHTDGSCSINLQAECLEPDIWQGPYTLCDPNPCPQPGACCQEDGTCSFGLESQCGGVWQGPNTSCDPNPCPQPGACCAINGSCTITQESQCGDTWMGPETSCDPNPCPQPVPSACCALDGVCTLTLPDDCQPPSVWHLEWTSCDPNPCPQPGACCAINGSCTLTQEFQCGGTWMGSGTVCDPNPCPQPIPSACCSPNGTCTLTLPDDCQPPSVWHLEWTSCDPNPCPQPGACCRYNGTCTITFESGCNGTWQGPNTVCVPNPCAPPPPPGGGDTIADAIVIPSLPYSDTGVTCGYNFDYSDCVYNAGAPDLVYAYTPMSDGAMNISLCGAGYDTALWVYAGGVGNTVGCNDDFCGLQSEIDGIQITGGVTYYIIVSGYNTACGSYVLNVTMQLPCDPIPCPSGGVPEGEPACYDNYYDGTNGGCNSTGWTVVPNDETVCGLSGTYYYSGASYRDTDWFDAVGNGGVATLTCTAAFPLQLLFIYASSGVISCSNYSYDIATAPCDVPAFLSRTITSGAHFWPWVGPSVFTGVPCNSTYTLDVRGLGGTGAIGACCVGDVCTITTEENCQGAWMGPNTTCAPNPCMATPVEKTTWGRIKSRYWK